MNMVDGQALEGAGTAGINSARPIRPRPQLKPLLPQLRRCQPTSQPEPLSNKPRQSPIFRRAMTNQSRTENRVVLKTLTVARLETVLIRWAEGSNTQHLTSFTSAVRVSAFRPDSKATALVDHHAALSGCPTPTSPRVKSDSATQTAEHLV